MVSYQALLRGTLVYDIDGERVGTIEDITLDGRGRPEWASLVIRPLATWRVAVPLATMTPYHGGVRVPYPRDQITRSPRIGVDPVDAEFRRRLRSHYGLRDGGAAPSPANAR